MKNQTRLMAGVIVLTLQACGPSKPTVADIEPSVTDLLGQCPLWKISDLKKVDGLSGDGSYQLQFSVKLALKQSPDQTRRTYGQNERNPSFLTCHAVISHLFVMGGRRPKMATEYNVEGSADLIKSENGWRVSGQLRDFVFSSTSAEVELGPIEDQRPAPPSPNTANSAPPLSTDVSRLESPTSTKSPSPCIEREMSVWRQQRDKDIDEAGKAARAKGEELQISAGQDAMVEQEALTNATATCSGH